MPLASPRYLPSRRLVTAPFDLEHVLPMHCSGANFTALAKQEIPEKLVLCATGSTYTFTA